MHATPHGRSIAFAVAGILSIATTSASYARELVPAASSLNQPSAQTAVVQPDGKKLATLQQQAALINQISDKFQADAASMYRNGFDGVEWKLEFGARLFHQRVEALTEGLQSADIASMNASLVRNATAKHTGGIETVATLLSNPCRIVDTRFGGGGLLGPSSRYWYASTSTPATIAGQGGNAAGCGYYPNAEAFLVYVTAVPPGAPLSGGAGFLTVQHDSGTPSTSTLNFYPGINIAAFASPACNGCGGGSGGFYAYASGNTHVVVDLIGILGATRNSYWASVDSAGAIVRGYGAITTGTSKISTGTYEVAFDKVITSCGYTATVGTPTASNTSGTVELSPRAGNPAALFVTTRDVSGALADRPFYLAINCSGD